MEIFKVGDRVFDIRFGWGEINIMTEFVIEVKFKNAIRHCYSFGSSDMELMSFTEYTLQGFSQERPGDLPEGGELVLVRDHIDNQWSVRYFSYYADGLYHCYLNGVNGGNTNGWLKCKRIKILD